MALYITLELLKASIKITADDRDDLLTQALTTASRQIDSWTGRLPDGFTLASSATARAFDVEGRTVSRRDGRVLLLVDEIGSTTDLTVEIGGGATWTTVTDYRVDPVNALTYSRPITGLTGMGWWVGTDQVRITAQWGWPATPQEISQACLIQAQRLYSRKDSPDGIRGGGDFGAIRLARMDPDVRELLGPFMLAGFA